MTEDGRYTEKQVLEIIDSGSLKDKAMLFLRDRMGYFGLGFILSYKDIEKLTLSVPEEKRKVWENYVSFGLRLENGFKDLERLLRDLTETREDLLRTLTEIRDFEILEEALNKLIDDDSEEFREGVDDPSLADKARDRIDDNRVLMSGLTLVKMTLDRSNHISLNLTGDKSLTERAKRIQSDLLELTKSFLCYESAMKRRIEESKIQVPEYGTRLRKNREVLERPISMRVRFQGRQDNRTYRTDLSDPKEETELPHPALRDLLENYSVYPDYINLNERENLEKINQYYNQI